MTVRTCTKVNIGLNILRRRPDGYHDLETLFVPYYGFGDTLTVEPADHISILIDFGGAQPWDPQKDLTLQAWRLLKADFPALPEVSIRLEKHSPVGAGLGGGSADAAFMLRALNGIGGLGLSDSRLAAYAAKLGSDCAFFIYNSPMYATGRGEVLEPFDIDLSAYELRVEIPLDAVSGLPVAVSTREAYSEVIPRENEISRLRPKGSARNDTTVSPGHASSAMRTPSVMRTPSAMRTPSVMRTPTPSVISSETKWSREISLKEALRLPVERWKDTVVNDFEKGVFAKHSEIAALKRKFYDDGAIYAAMSGSGSAVFGLFPKID